MKLLTNEDIPQESVGILKDAGFNVKHLGKRNSGQTDQQIIEMAINEKRTFVTFDKDFSDHILREGNLLPGGIVVFELKEFNDQFPAKMLVKMSSAMGLMFKKHYTIVKQNHINQRKY